MAYATIAKRAKKTRNETAKKNKKPKFAIKLLL